MNNMSTRVLVPNLKKQQKTTKKHIVLLVQRYSDICITNGIRENKGKQRLKLMQKL